MSTLYGGDFHFGDRGITKYQSSDSEGNPFKSVKERDEYLLTLWNEKVHSKDVVIIDGDLIRHNEKPFEWYLKRLNGILVLVPGNHDYDLLKDRHAMRYIANADNIQEIKFVPDVDEDGHGAIVCHYPIMEWNGFRKGVNHIYGHIHNQSPEVQKAMAEKNKYAEEQGFGMSVNCSMTPVPLAPMTFMEWKVIQKQKEQLLFEQPGIST